MTDILIRIMNLPAFAQRMIAMSVALAAFVATNMVIWTAFGLLNRDATSIEENRIALARYEKTIATGETFLRRPSASPPSSEFLPNETEAVMQANLQNKLSSLASIATATVLSSGGISSIEIDGVRYVGIRGNLQGTLKSVHGTLLQLETGKPYLIVRDMTVRAINSANLAVPVEISVQVSFFGALDPTTSGKSAP
ncbi:general secretion pathway protein GspM [Agrobacterium tumefaciens]|uniref:type II secretion system protein GspM n=1 Tax=Agrobacterium tumefaciens TaxID=358 RepID=UPI0012300ECC|nr:general secretion pathway protein GspM [Agrobacterium tumefaciens]